MPYNTVIVFTAFQVLPAASLNTNFSNLDYLKTQVDVQICNGRLTLESGVPRSTTDQTGKTTVYFTPFRGNKIGLYDGTAAAWDLYTFTEKSLALTGLIKGVVYDIFGYLSSGTLALEALAWKKVTASNSPTSGSSKVINISDTTNLIVGKEVTVRDGSNSEVATVTAVVANTSITVASLANSYTTPDIYGFATRATDITLNSGIWTKSGDTTRRFLGTIRISETTTGQCEDSTSRRYVWNVHNRVFRKLLCYDLTDSWTYTTATWRSANANNAYGTGRVGLVVGLNDDLVDAVATAIVSSATTDSYCACGIGVNQTNVNSSDIRGGWKSAATRNWQAAFYKGTLEIGFSFLQRLEISDAVGTTTWYGDAGFTFVGTGLYAWIPM